MFSFIHILKKYIYLSVHCLQDQMWSFKLGRVCNLIRHSLVDESFNSSLYPNKFQIWLHQLFKPLLFPCLICHVDWSQAYTSSTIISLSQHYPDLSKATFPAWSRKVNLCQGEERMTSQTKTGWREPKTQILLHKKADNINVRETY